MKINKEVLNKVTKKGMVLVTRTALVGTIVLTGTKRTINFRDEFGKEK